MIRGKLTYSIYELILFKFSLAEFFFQLAQVDGKKILYNNRFAIALEEKLNIYSFYSSPPGLSILTFYKIYDRLLTRKDCPTRTYLCNR